ncbi:MAG: hypothetical protein M1817_005765 [Caeruleum heppii]|nr:MAG: hypothetical protein M1817_005765 [Caeruleum heppii]
MAGPPGSPLEYWSRRGSLYFIPDGLSSPAQDEPVYDYHFRSRRRRPQSIHITREVIEAPQYSIPTYKRRSSLIEKLAGPRENAKRFLRSVISSSSSPSADQTERAAPTDPAIARRRSTLNRPRPPAETDAASPMQMNAIRADWGRSSVSAPNSNSTSRPSLSENTRTGSGSGSPIRRSSPSLTPHKQNFEEKPLASGNGISVYVTLAEPVLYLQGFEQNDDSSRTTAMLRGSLVLKVTKAAKIKAVTLNFRGRARTEWPEGIPPRKTEYYEEQIINRHTWPFFNAQFPTAEKGPGADQVKVAKNCGATVSTLQIPSSGRLAFDQFARSASPFSTGRSTREQKRQSLQLTQSRSFGRDECAGKGPTVAQRGYRTFQPGDYIYNFELPLDSHLPETIDVELGQVRYELEAIVDRAGAFRANLLGWKEVTLIRAPSESSLETVEPIAISRNWEDQLHYDIVISGKSFPLGAQVPIAFKLTPLAKVQCHRIKVFVTETIEYYCSNKKVHRLEPTRKVQLFEKRADAPSSSTYPGSSMRILSGGGVSYDSREAAALGDETVTRDTTNLLGNLDGEHNAGPTEMEFNVQLPSCSSVREGERNFRLHFDTTYSNIQVHHWIKIVMRLSKPDQQDPSKRRHFEISIDSPFHILSCQATQANIALPAYSNVADGASYVPAVPAPSDCLCPGAVARRWQQSSIDAARDTLSTSEPREEVNSIPAPPPRAHLDASRSSDVQRPIHLLRAPSFNPPAFDAELPPPPLITPPPQYDSVVGEGEGLADYFARLADDIGDEEDDDERGRGRVELPLTPGGRLNRSMDERRTWLPVGH